MEFEAFLLDIDYETFQGKAHLRLFLRDSTGKKRVVYDDTFAPYFYVLPGKDPESLKKVLVEEGAVEVEVVKRKLLRREVLALKVFANHPQEIPKLRERIKKLEGVDLTLEYDIPFARRYLIDRQIKPFQWYRVETEERDGREMLIGIQPKEDAPPPEVKILALDIEVYNPKGAPRPEKDPIIMVSLAGSDGYRKLLTWKPIEGEHVEVLSSEREMLKRLEEILNSSAYDVITGYNTDSFDFPYIKKRLKVLNQDFLIEGKKIEIRGQKNLPEAKIRGLAHVDLYPIIRRNVKLNSYVLENVVLEILGEEKNKIEKIWEYWDAGGEKLRELASYALEDAVVTLRLAEKFLPLYLQLSHLIGQSLQDVSRFTTGQMVEWYLMAVASQSKELVPNKPKGEEVKSRLSESYVGGYVKEPEKGIVEQIAVFDFRSLYPSIIVTHNIDPATLITGDCTENKAPGLEYCFSQEIKGFIPQILEDLIKRRSEIKKKLKSCQNEIERKMLDVSQHALKILANSFYGYMGYPRARWYRRECAESVAAFARHYIKKVMKIAEEEFNFRVVYGDTDSLFIVLPEKEKAYEFLNYVNRSMPGIIELELEGFYKRALFVTKKRYALLSEDDKIIVKGLELVRRDWAPIAKKTQKRILEIILRENNPEKAAGYVRDVIENIRNRKVTLEDITIYTQITKKIESYEGKEPHVGAAKKLREAGVEVVPGMIIGYIVTRGAKKISDRTIPVELAKIEDYDPEYYIENQIMPAVLRIFEALGYKKDFLKSGIKQKSLLSF